MKRKVFSPSPSYLFLQKGQSLIEAIASLAIIGIVVTAIAIAVATTLSNTKFNRDETLATKYAQQGSELVRQIRNTSYTGFKTFNGLYCVGKDQMTLGTVQSSCTVPNTDSFIRSVQIDQAPGCDTNVAKVTVNVAFMDGKCATNTYCHTITNTSCLSTVNTIQTP